MAGVAVSLVVLVILSTVVVDAMAYLVAAARAQSTADAAALAAAGAADPLLAGSTSPRSAAGAVAVANGGTLMACRCPALAPTLATGVTVEVAVPVRALVATRFGPREVVAEAAATLVPPRPP